MKYTIADLRADFPNDDVCLDYIFRLKFSGAVGYKRVKGRKAYVNTKTSRQICPLSKTIFATSSTPLTLWFYAIFLFSTSKNGVSAKELERQLGVTYKTAWRMATQIRKLMQQGGDPLSGVVEADEGFIGHGKTQKTVIAAIARGGGIRAKVIENKGHGHVHPFIKENVAAGSFLMTDSNPVYINAGDYKHRPVNHGRSYVKGSSHTNHVEAYWSHVKRSIAGTYHWVSPKYLQQYLNEFAWKYEQRFSSVPLFSLLLREACR